MSLSKLFFIILGNLLLTLTAISLSLAQEPPTAAPFIPGEIIVKFKPGAAPSILQATTSQTVETSFCGGLFSSQVEPGQEAATIAELLKHDEVEFATYNRPIQALRTPDDPQYSWQWGLNNIGGSDISALQAWDITTGSDAVIIAVLDSGIDLTHPDLKDKIVDGYNFILPGDPADDDYGHGTHVSGIAAASANNRVGIAGVSWGARVMPIKVLDEKGSGSSYNLAKGICYAIDHGAKIINMSVGQRGSRWPCNMPEMELAFQYVKTHDALLVMAAGNDGQDGVNCPAAYDEVLSVGSTNSSDLLSSFSNYGDRLDIVAPGSDIYSTIPGGYSYKSGTSMATPHVSGLAALIWSLDPSLSSAEVRQIIESTANDLGEAGWDGRYGWGRINAYHALQSLLKVNVSITESNYYLGDNAPPVPISETVTITTNNETAITWTMAVSPSVSWLTIQPNGIFTVTATAPHTLTWQVTRPITYGDYSTTMMIQVGTINISATKIYLRYVPQLYQYYFPHFLQSMEKQ